MLNTPLNRLTRFQVSTCGRWKNSGSRRKGITSATMWPPSCRAVSPWSAATARTTPPSSERTMTGPIDRHPFSSHYRVRVCVCLCVCGCLFVFFLSLRKHLCIPIQIPAFKYKQHRGLCIFCVKAGHFERTCACCICLWPISNHIPRSGHVYIQNNLCQNYKWSERVWFCPSLPLILIGWHTAVIDARALCDVTHVSPERVPKCITSASLCVSVTVRYPLLRA